MPGLALHISSSHLQSDTAAHIAMSMLYACFYQMTLHNVPLWGLEDTHLCPAWPACCFDR